MTDAELAQIEAQGALLWSRKKTAILLGMSPEEENILNDPTSDAYSAWYRGRLITESKVRAGTIQFAIQGSTPAITSVIKMINDSAMEDTE